MEKLLNEGVLNENNIKTPLSIVVITASSNGLAWLQEFFDTMPQNSNLSFIVVQNEFHELNRLLAGLSPKHSPTKVITAIDGIQIEENCIYVIPNNERFALYNGKLHNRKNEPEGQSHTSLNYFLHSYANESHKNAIAVILPADRVVDTAGIEAIRNVGGKVFFIQQSETGCLDSRPNNSIALEDKDLTLSPKQIAEAISNYVEGGQFFLEASAPSFLTGKERMYRNLHCEDSDSQNRYIKQLESELKEAKQRELDLIANQKVNKSESLFRFLAEVIPQKIWTAFPDGTAAYFNKVWTDFAGKSMAELKGWGWLDTVHPDDLDENKRLWAKAVQSGEDFEMERRLRKANGEYIWHLSRSIPQRDELGNITMWVGTSTDIHDQKTETEALRESEDYFRQLADQSPFMIWKVDGKGLCNYVNRQWIDFTGFSFEDSMGLGWNLAFHPEDSDREYKKFLAAFHKREIYYSKFRLKKGKGEYHWFLAQANPLKGGSVFEGYIGSLTDITEQELAQQATRLLMQKKDEFMSIASHELKTPITSMKASLQIAKRLSGDNAGPEKIQGFIDRANKQVNKLTSLVEDLLDVTKIQAGKMQFDVAVFNLDEAIYDCIEQLQGGGADHQIVITGQRGIQVLGDKHRVEQVVMNFLSNAIKYSPGSREVHLNVQCEEDSVKVSISDFGIGIPEDKIKYIFGRFFRVQESSQKFSGLGLGLFISSEIIKRHNGKVGVVSEEGKGSTFWFTLPVANITSI